MVYLLLKKVNLHLILNNKISPIKHHFLEEPQLHRHHHFLEELQLRRHHHFLDQNQLGRDHYLEEMQLLRQHSLEGMQLGRHHNSEVIIQLKHLFLEKTKLNHNRFLEALILYKHNNKTNNLIASGQVDYLVVTLSLNNNYLDKINLQELFLPTVLE